MEHSQPPPPLGPNPDRPLLPSLPPAPPATSGSFRLRVRYNECDPMGFVHHAAYGPWLEMGRTELLRTSGLSYAQLESQGVLLVIIRLEVRYKRPAKYDDVVEVRTRVAGSSRVKLEHEYEVVLIEGADGSKPEEPIVLTTASTTLASIGRDGRPRPLPEWMISGVQSDRA